MAVKQRIISLKYLEKQKKNNDFAKKIGVEVKMKTNKKGENVYEWNAYSE